MQTDQTALTAAFGCHIVQTEADDLLRLERTVSESEIDEEESSDSRLCSTRPIRFPIR